VRVLDADLDGSLDLAVVNGHMTIRWRRRGAGYAHLRIVSERRHGSLPMRRLKLARFNQPKVGRGSRTEILIAT